MRQQELFEREHETLIHSPYWNKSVERGVKKIERFDTEEERETEINYQSEEGKCILGGRERNREIEK